MPTIEQIRAARALLGWSQHDLADKADLSQTGIARIENGTNQPNSKTIAKIENAFDKADVEFIDNSGVKKRVEQIRTLKGTDGFREFLDDVYETALNVGGNMCLHNAKPRNWFKWVGEEWYHNVHVKRMNNIKDNIDLKITSQKDDNLFIGSSFAEYRWLPDEMFNENSIYSYGNKLAFLSFIGEDEVHINILEKKEFAEGFRMLFKATWENIAIIPTDKK